MDNHTISVFLNEIATQYGYALSAASQINNALKALYQDTNSEDDLKRRQLLQGEVFRGLHSLLTHTSNVSRILWPPTGNGAAATAELRSAKFSVPNTGCGMIWFQPAHPEPV
jgi:hypothetical protein